MSNRISESLRRSIKVQNEISLVPVHEAAFLGAVLRSLATQAAMGAAQKGIQKGISSVKDIMADMEKEGPVQTVQKLHNLGHHAATFNTPEAKLARERSVDLAKKHGLKMGPDGPKADVKVAIQKAAAKQGVTIQHPKKTWADTVAAFNKGLKGE